MDGRVKRYAWLMVVIGVISGCSQSSDDIGKAAPETGKAAQSAKAAEQTPYTLLQPPAPTGVAANRIEVVEFFEYGCSYCYNFESFIEVWNRRKPPDVEFVRVPVLYGKRRPFARLYYALLRLGRIGGPADLHHELFDAVHRVGLPLTDADEAKAFRLQRDFVSARGVDAREFERVYYSPEVEADLRRAEERAREMQVTSWPVVVVNGKFKTHAMQVGGERNLIRVINELSAEETRLLSASRNAPGE